MRDKVLAILATIVAWVRGLTDREIPTRMRGWVAADARAQSSTQTVVATGAGIASTGGLIALIRDYWIGGTLYQLSLESAALVDNLGNIGTIVGTFFAQLDALIAAAIPDQIILAGVRVSAASLQGYGIAAFVVAVAATIAGVWLLIVWIRNVDWSPIGLFFGGKQ